MRLYQMLRCWFKGYVCESFIVPWRGPTVFCRRTRHHFGKHRCHERTWK
jgi:hypothetical protein